MYSAPLHRKVLPWVYTLLFFLVAPLLIFYTAGYRYNTKKASVEKYGTLIVDSTPTNAEVFVDGRATGETTPTTFQELSSGQHTIEVRKTGYTPWKKTLDMRAERVTFANHIHLWRTEPVVQLLQEGNFFAIEATREGDTALALERTANSSTLARIVHAKGRLGEDLALPFIEQRADLFWDETGRFIHIDRPSTERDLLVRLGNRSLTATTTPWRGTWNPPEPDELELRSTSSGVDLILKKTFSERHIPLPDRQAWRFGDAFSQDIVLLQGETRWVSLDPHIQQPSITTIMGDYPRWSPSDTSHAEALFLTKSELWSWKPGNEPALLVRQSTPLEEAVWHADADTVFLSTMQTIEAIDLDERDGRMRQTLASFEEIRDFALIGNALVVAGTHEGVAGLFLLTIE